MTDITDMDEKPAIPDEIATHELTETPVSYAEKLQETEAAEAKDEPITIEQTTDEPEKGIFAIDEANDKGIKCELLQTDYDESKKSGDLSEKTEKNIVEAESKVTPDINKTNKVEDQNSSEENIPEETEMLNEETIENSTSSEKDIPIKMEKDDTESRCEPINEDKIEEVSETREENASSESTKTEATEKLNEGTIENPTLLEKDNPVKMEKDDAESRCEPISEDNINDSSAIPEENASPEPTETLASGSEKSYQTITEPAEPANEPSRNQSTTDQPEKNNSPTDETFEKGVKTADDESNKIENVSKETAKINFEAQIKGIIQNDGRRIEYRNLLENEETIENLTSEKEPDKADQVQKEKSTCELPNKSIVQELKNHLEQTKIENSKLEGKVQVLDEKYQNIMEMYCEIVAAYQVEKTKIIQEYEGKIRDVLVSKTQLEEQIKQVEAADIANVQNVVSILKDTEQAPKDKNYTEDLENDVSNEDNCSSKKEKEIQGYNKMLKEESSRGSLSEMHEETKEAGTIFPKTVEEEKENEDKHKLETEMSDLEGVPSEVDKDAKHVVDEDEISKSETLESYDISRANLVEMQTKINELEEVTKSLQEQLDVLKKVIELNESSLNKTKKPLEDGSYTEKSHKDITKEEGIFSEKEKEVHEYDYVLHTKSAKSHLAEVKESTESFLPKALDEFDNAIKQADEEHEKILEKLETEKANLIKKLTQVEEQPEYYLDKDEDSKTKTKQPSDMSDTDLVEMESKINELQKVVKFLQEQLDKMKNGDELNELNITKMIQEDVREGEKSSKDLIKEESCSPEKEKEIEDINKILNAKSSKTVSPNVKEQIKDNDTSTPNTIEEFDILIQQTEEEHKERQKKLETEKAILEQMLKEQEKQCVDEDKNTTPELSDTSDTNESRISAMENKIDELEEVLKSLQWQLKNVKNFNEITERGLSETNMKEEEEQKLKESKIGMTTEEECPLKSKEVFQDDDKIQKMTTPKNPVSEKEKNEYDAILSKSSVEDEILFRKTKEHNESKEAENTKLAKKQSENFEDRDKVEEMQSKIDELQKVIRSLEEKNESILSNCRDKLADMENSKETAIQNFKLQIKNLMEEKEKMTKSNKDKKNDSVYLRTNTVFIESNYDRQVVEVRAEMREKCEIEAKLVKEVTMEAVVKKYEEMLAKVSDTKQEILDTFTESVKSYEVKIHDIHIFYEERLESLRQQKENEQCAAAQNEIEALQNKCKDLETHYIDLMDKMKKEMEEEWENERRKMEVNFEKEKEVLKTNYDNAMEEIENEMKENWENERKEIKAAFEKEKEMLETQYKCEMEEMKNKTNERWENEKKEMETKFEKEKQVLGATFKDEMDQMKNKMNKSNENEKREIEAKFEKEKKALESRYKDEMDAMKNKANERWENEMKKMEAKFEKEKDLLDAHYKDEMDEMKNKTNESWENERREMEAKFEKEKEVLVGQNEKGEQEYESKMNELSKTYERRISQMALDYSALEEKYYAAIKQLEEILGSMKMPRESAVASCVTIICSKCSNEETNKIATNTSADNCLQLNHNLSKESQARDEKNINKEEKNEHAISTTNDDQNKPLSILRDKDKNKQRSIVNNKTPHECDNLPNREDKNSTLVFESSVLTSSNRGCLIGSSIQETSPVTIKKNNGCFPAVKKETTGKQKDRGKKSHVAEKPFLDFQKSLKMLKEKQELEDLLKSLQNEISQEQLNFLQAMQFKKDGQFDELSQSSAKRMVEEKLHLETELKIVTQEILNLLEDNGLQRNCKKIAAKAKQKDEIELSLEILEESVNAEPMRAAEALTCLLEAKSRCQDQLEALDKGLKEIKEEIELKLKHEKNFVNNLPEQLILELCLSP